MGTSVVVSSATRASTRADPQDEQKRDPGGLVLPHWLQNIAAARLRPGHPSVRDR
jgi:hypothetical protein